MSEWRIKLYRGTYAAVRSHGGQTERVSLRTKNLEEAKRSFQDWLKTPLGETVEELVEAYLKDKDKTAIRADNMRVAWKASKPHFGHLRPDQVTRDTCRAYVAHRSKLGRKPNTIRKEIEVIRAGLNWHKRGDKSIFELPSPPPPKDRVLTKAEVRALTKAARQFPHVRAFIALSIATGARQSALLELTWNRVDFQKHLISLPRGEADDITRKSRAVVPMNTRARRYLRVLHAARQTDHVIEWAQQRVYSVKKGFATAAKKAGLKDITPHVLRHTAASWMAMAGVPMLEISRYLGHSDTRVTERRYAHLHPEYLRRASKTLDW